jgi:hypothetical protein
MRYLTIALIMFGSVVAHAQKAWEQRLAKRLEKRAQHDENWKELLRVLRHPMPNAVSKPRFDGIYEVDRTNDIHSIVFTNPAIFFENGIIDAHTGGNVNYQWLVDGYTRRLGKPFMRFGAFEMLGDTINAYFFTALSKRADVLDWYAVHFNGILKDRNTIVNWHMVPPFPAQPFLPGGKLEFPTAPATLVFKPHPVQHLLDMHSLWLEQYRKQ